MESSIESTIEKIKQQEHDKEVKLKEKRTHETLVLSLSRSVRDALTHAAKLEQDHLDSLAKTEALSLQLELEKARRNALSGVLKDAQKELQLLQEKSTQGVSTVWSLRSLLCKSVQNVSDQCDVWALFSKPKSIQLPIAKKVVVIENTEQAKENDNRLKNAVDKHKMMLVERDRLQMEPDTGEEFVRIKNALRYSASMAANLK